MYNINIWVYTPCDEGHIELFKPLDGFDNDKKGVRILFWRNHCALIKTIETLLDQPNKINDKFFYCDRCTCCFNSQIKNAKHGCSHSFKPKILCPRKKKIAFINEHKRQIIRNIITSDIECCVVDVTTKTHKYVVAEHIPISVGYVRLSNFK